MMERKVPWHLPILMFIVGCIISTACYFLYIFIGGK